MQKLSVKKFIKRLLLIVVPVYILWYSYIEYMPMHYNQANNTRWHFIGKCLDGNIQLPKSSVLFLGESRVNAAVDFTKIPNSYSFASGGSTALEMYYILKKYVGMYGSPDTVFLSISPRFLSEIYAFYPYAVRNDLFSFSDFNEIKSNYSDEDTTLGKRPGLKFLLYKVNYIEYYQSDVLNNFVFGAFKENKELIEEMEHMKGGRIHPDLKDSCSDLNYETGYRSFKPSPILDHYLHMIFSYCNETGIHIIFDFVPVNESSFKEFKEEFLNGYRDYINSLQYDYPEFQISDTVFFYEDTYFGDESHLNLKGKQLYTQYVLDMYFN